MEYRPLDLKEDWPFFMPDLMVPNDCLSRIYPLTELSALGLWREFVSPKLIHAMELPDGHWSTRLSDSEVSAKWKDDWNDGASGVFIEWLRTALCWQDGTSVFFSWSASDTVETAWGVFCQCWRNFLFDDEGPILWSLQHSQAVRFLPSGAYIGLRT